MTKGGRPSKYNWEAIKKLNNIGFVNGKTKI